MTYDRVVSAALAETKSKFDLAEALAEDIPPRRSGPSDDVTIKDYLTEARQVVIDAGGEPRSVKTLSDYRFTALWVSAEVGTNYRWLPGISFSAHQEANRAGLSYDEFVAMPSKTVDAIRDRTEKAGTDGPPERIVSSWSPEQKASAARELLSDPEVAESVGDAITDYVAADPERTTDVIRKRQKTEGIPEAQPRKAGRDYDAMTEQHINGLSMVLAAESSGVWAPSSRSEALLYFVAQVLGNRREPTGEQADLVNERLESLFNEVEEYANSEVT